jgi:hypothetical protein
MCVEYFLIFLNNIRGKEKLKKNLMRRLKMKDTGGAMQYRKNKVVCMNQQKHTEETLQQSGMFDVKSMATPLAVNQNCKG